MHAGNLPGMRSDAGASRNSNSPQHPHHRFPPHSIACVSRMCCAHEKGQHFIPSRELQKGRSVDYRQPTQSNGFTLTDAISVELAVDYRQPQR